MNNVQHNPHLKNHDQQSHERYGNEQDGSGHHIHHQHASTSDGKVDHSDISLDKIAVMATIHCLTGCAIGEVAGMVIGTYLGWSNFETIMLAVVLAFASGFGLTMLPLWRNGYRVRAAARVALAADTASIAVMEVVDNTAMLLIPGSMGAPLDSPLFWVSLAFALVIAGIFAFPVNRWLIKRGRGHAIVHRHH